MSMDKNRLAAMYTLAVSLRLDGQASRGDCVAELCDEIATLQRELAEQRGAHQRAAHVVRDLQRELDAWRDRYNREVLGLDNEGDPIGGDPPRGLKHAVEDLRAQVLSLQSCAFKMEAVCNVASEISLLNESEESDMQIQFELMPQLKTVLRDWRLARNAALAGQPSQPPEQP